jgi:hypothetical protein
MAATGKPVITEEDGIWVIRVENGNGKTQEFRCASERQARQLALVLSAPDRSGATAPR